MAKEGYGINITKQKTIKQISKYGAGQFVTIKTLYGINYFFKAKEICAKISKRH
jgi:hypothetical protein